MIRKFLDCSSAHLSPDTWVWLDAQLSDDVLRDPLNTQAAGIAGGRARYGWFLYAAEDCLELYPEDLVAVFREARRRGAEYILFDCDAEVMTGQPVRHPDFLS
jgi:hypothetical protein